MSRQKTAIGLMSGTSMDGIDVALVKTDGEGFVARGPSLYIPYDAGLRACWRKALVTAKAITGIDGGYVAAVLQQDPEQMGVQALKALNDITAGKTVPKKILVPATVVTKTNVDTYRPLFK